MKDFFEGIEKKIQKNTKKYYKTLCKINIPESPNFPINNPTRYIIPVKKLLCGEDMCYDKTRKIYLTQSKEDCCLAKNEWRFKEMLDKKYCVYYNYLRDGYITMLEFNKDLAGDKIIIKGI